MAVSSDERRRGEASAMSDRRRMSEAMTMTRTTMGRGILACAYFPDLAAVAPPGFFVFVAGKKDQ